MKSLDLGLVQHHRRKLLKFRLHWLLNLKQKLKQNIFKLNLCFFFKFLLPQRISNLKMIVIGQQWPGSEKNYYKVK